MLQRGASGWQEVQLLLILNLGTRRGWVVSIMPRSCFTPQERDPSTHCIGGWVGPRAGLDTEVWGKILSVGDRTPVVQSVVSHCTDSPTRLMSVLYTLCKTVCGERRRWSNVLGRTEIAFTTNFLVKILHLLTLQSRSTVVCVPMWHNLTYLPMKRNV
jgi:hypothetical protein